MATNFPTSLDTFTTHVNGDTILPTYDNNQQDALLALQTKVGIDNSAVTATLDYKLKSTSSIDPGHKHNLAVSLNDVLITTPVDGNVLTYQSSSGKWINSGTSAPDATTVVKGVSKMSVAPVLSTAPISVGDNDPRVSTQAENDAQVGNNTDVAVGTGNKFVTQTGLQHNAEKYVADASGSSTAYTATLSPAPTSYTTGMVFYIKIVNANTTTTPTLNVNSLGAKTIVKGVNTALVVGDILANQFCTLIYDGTNLVLQNPQYPDLGFLTSGALGTSVANTTTTVLTYALAGGILSTNKGVKIRFTIRDVESGGVTGVAPTITIKYGGTSIGTWAITATAANRTIDVITETILFGAGTTNSQRANSYSLSSISTIAGLSQGTTAIDSTTSQNITIEISSPSAGLTCTFVDHFIQKIT